MAEDRNNVWVNRMSYIMCSIEWRHYQWPCLILKIILNISRSNIFPNSIRTFAAIHLRTNITSYVGNNRPIICRNRSERLFTVTGNDVRQTSIDISEAVQESDMLSIELCHCQWPWAPLQLRLSDNKCIVYFSGLWQKVQAFYRRTTLPMTLSDLWVIYFIK